MTGKRKSATSHPPKDIPQEPEISSTEGSAAWNACVPPNSKRVADPRVKEPTRSRPRPHRSSGDARVKKLVAFDLDGTLAQSKSAIDGETAALLVRLLETMQVAIISGGDTPQFEQQVLGHLAKDAPLANLSILPTCGTKFLQYRDGWHTLYSEDLSPAEKQKIEGSAQRRRRGCGKQDRQSVGRANSGSRDAGYVLGSRSASSAR